MTRIDYRKIHRSLSYTILEIVDKLGVNKKTCLRWIEAGLQVIHGSKRPILIKGDDLKLFLKGKNLKRKFVLKKDEFNCFGCRGPTRAKRGSVKISGNKKRGICPGCNGRVVRTIKLVRKDYKIPSSTVQMSLFNNNNNGH